MQHMWEIRMKAPAARLSAEATCVSGARKDSKTSVLVQEEIEAMAIAKVPARINSGNVLKAALHQANCGEVFSFTASLTKQE